MSTNADRYRTITDKQVCDATGKTWTEWITLLDAWGASKGSLISIANHLMEQYQLTLFWAQAIAVNYRWEHS
jgi:hypothetical protein